MLDETDCQECGAKRTAFSGQVSWECGSYQTYVPGLNPFWMTNVSEHCKCRQALASTQALWRQAVTDANACADELRDALKKLAQSTNYVADDVEYPHAIWFANGRKVWIETGGHLGVGMADTLSVQRPE